MIKYLTAAACLKLCSSSSLMKRCYRFLGNEFGSKRRIQSHLPGYYVDRVKRYLSLCKKYNAIKDGDKLLEVGTGWIHWESLSLSLFFDIKATLFDIWDNRQLSALKKYCLWFDAMIDKEIDFDPERKARAHRIIKSITLADNFEDLYDLLNFEYLINPEGKLDNFRDESYNIIISGGVLEHVNRVYISEYINNLGRLLKQDGYSIHSINITDHLSMYTNRVSLKNYLQYSDKIWKTYFENDVQYFNRIQKTEWLELFSRSGLELIEEQSDYLNISDLRIDKQYEVLSKEDLACIHIKLLHTKRPVN